MNNKTVEKTLKLHGHLKSDRCNYESMWQEIVDNISPRALDFQRLSTRGEKKRTKILDSTPGQALRDLASSLVGFMASPTEIWFTLEPETVEQMQDVAVKEYLEKMTDTLFKLFRNGRTSFYASLHSFFLELVALGTAVLFVNEHDDHICHFKAISLAECYIQENADGLVERLHREFKFTPEQILEKFEETIDTLTLGLLLEKQEKAPTELLTVIHAVGKRKNYDKDKVDSKNKPYESIYILEENKGLLREGGYDEFPYMVMRWSKRPGEIYGRGPGEEALADVKVLYAMVETVVKAGQKAVSPPLQAPDDSFIGDIDTRPEAINYYRASFGGSDPTIRPIEMSGSIPIGLEMEDRRRKQISVGFYSDVMQDNKANVEQTATEYLGNEEKRMRTLAPQAGIAEAELFSPLIERVINIIIRKVKEANPKEAINYKVNYVSPLARAQRMTQALQIVRMLEQTAQFVQVFPEILMRINQDELIKHLLYLHNTPSKLVRSDEEVAELKQQQQQQMQAQQQVALAEQGSKAIKNVASAGGDLENVAQ